MLRMGVEGRGERLIRVTDKAQTPEQLIRGLQHDASLKKKKKKRRQIKNQTFHELYHADITGEIGIHCQETQFVKSINESAKLEFLLFCAPTCSSH